MTQKESFLYYMSQMDIEKIKDVLDDDVNYFGASKEVFIHKLNYVFKQIKLTGHTGHLPVKPNRCREDTFYLVLRKVNKLIKFVIKEDNDRIIKMEGVKVKRTREAVESLHPFEMFFGDDERLDFKVTPDYKNKLIQCNFYHNQLAGYKDRIFCLYELENWFRKSTPLFQEIKDDFLMFRFAAFTNLYSSIEFLLNQLRCSEQAKQGLKDFYDPDRVSIEEWYRLYHELFFFETNFFNVDIIMLQKDLGIAKHRFHKNLIIMGEEVTHIYEFNELWEQIIE